MMSIFQMFELFDSIFESYLKKYKCEWFVLFDSDDFIRVENTIAKALGISLIELDNHIAYKQWYMNMANDL